MQSLGEPKSRWPIASDQRQPQVLLGTGDRQKVLIEVLADHLMVDAKIGDFVVSLPCLTGDVQIAVYIDCLMMGAQIVVFADRLMPDELRCHSQVIWVRGDAASAHAKLSPWKFASPELIAVSNSCLTKRGMTAP